MCRDKRVDLRDLEDFWRDRFGRRRRGRIASEKREKRGQREMERVR